MSEETFECHKVVPPQLLNPDQERELISGEKMEAVDSEFKKIDQQKGKNSAYARYVEG